MVRYLVYFGYIGSGLHGIPRIPTLHGEDLTTIQGILEAGLRKLKPKQSPVFYSSSRTDAGVHGLCSTGHFDLDHPTMKYDPHQITSSLNQFLKDNHLNVKIHKTLKVSDDFSARYDPISRTYLYRLLVLNENKKMLDFNRHIPQAEQDKCGVFFPPFDVKKFSNAAQFLIGRHDFSSFTKKSKTERSPIRELYSISVHPGYGFLSNHDELYRDLQVWNIVFTGRSYVYQQIRRIVGALQAVASDKLDTDYIKYMIENPSRDNWPHALSPAPPEGLYLANVQYPNHTLELDYTRPEITNDNANLKLEKKL